MHRFEDSKEALGRCSRFVDAGSVVRLPKLGVAQVRSPQPRHTEEQDATCKHGRPQRDSILGHPRDHSQQAKFADLRQGGRRDQLRRGSSGDKAPRAGRRTKRG
jgi:hypothetical protein